MYRFTTHSLFITLENLHEYKFFDFHHECHVDSTPMSNLVSNFVFPNNLVNTGIFCEDYRLIQENN